jgi:hypothetical protein
MRQSNLSIGIAFKCAEFKSDPDISHWQVPQVIYLLGYAVVTSATTSIFINVRGQERLHLENEVPAYALAAVLIHI